MVVAVQLGSAQTQQLAVSGLKGSKALISSYVGLFVWFVSRGRCLVSPFRPFPHCPSCASGPPQCLLCPPAVGSKPSRRVRGAYASNSELEGEEGGEKNTGGTQITHSLTSITPQHNSSYTG